MKATRKRQKVKGRVMGVCVFREELLALQTVGGEL